MLWRWARLVRKQSGGLNWVGKSWGRMVLVGEIEIGWGIWGIGWMMMEVGVEQRWLGNWIFAGENRRGWTIARTIVWDWGYGRELVRPRRAYWASRPFLRQQDARWSAR